MDKRDAPIPAERLISVDLLRGFAIMWVVLFHLWGDIEFFPLAPSVYYAQLTDNIRDGAPPFAILTSFTDLFFRTGFQGVPLFMMISGISLTIAAYRLGDGLAWPAFFGQRFRKLLVPYWVGVVLTYAVMAGIAWRQSAMGDASFADSFTSGVTIAVGSVINVDWGVAYASFALYPRMMRAEWFFAPQLALWFVGLLAQYYLMFPVLFAVMRRIGAPAFLLATFAVTVLANVWIVDRYGAPEFRFWMVTGWAPFRLFEFTFGMAAGWLLVAPDAARARRVLRHPITIVAMLFVGLAAHTAGGLMIGEWTLRYWQSFALPLVTLGLGLLVLPLLLRGPSAQNAAWPLRAFAAVGVMSYAILIVNDPLRLIASQLRVEGIEGVAWWLFLIAYVPVSVALAWPLARVLGLMPRRRIAAAREPAPARDEPEVVLAPASV
jgi:peptidoglycan/LPS O-acetylase OafA/YrhL